MADTNTAVDMNSAGMSYPLTKMNFLVSLPDSAGSMAAFSEVTGIEASVDVIEFRQGNAHFLRKRQVEGTNLNARRIRIFPECRPVDSVCILHRHAQFHTADTAGSIML